MLVIRGGRVFDAARRAAEPGDVLIDGDTIAELGPPGLAAPEGSEAIGAEARILIPGLVNAHTHGHSNLHRSTGDRWTLEHLLNAGPLIRGDLSIEDRYLNTLIGAVEMVSKGCTACYDLFYEFPMPSAQGISAVARAYADVGMRAVIAPMMTDSTFYASVPGLLDAIPDELRGPWEAASKVRSIPWEACFEVIERAIREWNFDRDQIRLAVAPTIPLHCSDEYLRRTAAFARDWGCGFHTHLAESKVQAVSGVARYGRSLTAHLDALGVLGPNFTAAHCVWVDDDDLARLADNGCSVAHNPGSNMRLGTGLAAVRRMLDKGVAVGVGTDGRTYSDNQNMFEAMRLAAFTSRVQGPDFSRWLSSDEVFGMASRGSAGTLGLEAKIGAIAPGHKADIVFLDLRNTNYVPLNDATNQIVFAEDATGVKSVMIGGRLVYENRRFANIDTDGLAARAEAVVERLGAGSEAAKELALKLEAVVASFCGGLAKQPFHVHRYAGGDEG